MYVIFKYFFQFIIFIKTNSLFIRKDCVPLWYIYLLKYCIGPNLNIRIFIKYYPGIKSRIHTAPQLHGRGHKVQNSNWQLSNDWAGIIFYDVFCWSYTCVAAIATSCNQDTAAAPSNLQ